MTASEPRNPFYLLLLLSSLLFTVTAVAYAVVPLVEDKAKAAGEVVPPSAWREALRSDGWKWLLYEVAGVIVFGLMSMGLDRQRRLRRERAAALQPASTATLPSTDNLPSSAPPNA
jgi:hypothetical protein